MRKQATNSFHPLTHVQSSDLTPYGQMTDDLATPDKLSPLSANILGLQVSGDLGPLTIYTDRLGRKIAFPKSPPKKPPSPAQVIQRARFSSAQAAYMALSDPQKESYELLTILASFCLTGQNLFISVALTHSFQFLDTIERQFGIQVEHPPAL